MTIEEMTTMSYIFLAIAVVLGIVAVVLFITLKIPKAYRSVKGQKNSTKRYAGRRKKTASRKSKQRKKSEKNSQKTVKLGGNQSKDKEEDKTEILNGEKVQFNMLQDITYVHVEEEL